MTDSKTALLGRVADDLEAIEAELHANLNPHLDLIRRVAGHILFSGGKRLRPLLMVLAARLCGSPGDRDPLYATAFEYLHAATLLHDDLVDGATLRRGRRVASRVWDSSTAVLTGDFLLARALSIGARTGKLRVIEIMAHLTEEMSQGEIHQLANRGRLDVDEAEYREVIRRKTAVLIEAACRVGAVVAGAPEVREDALGRFGRHLGMAFQMVDDLLDYTADTGDLGKQVGTDLREGKLTLPLIHALAQAGPIERARMQALVGRIDVSRDAFNALVGRLEALGGLAYTRRKAAEHVECARADLERFFGPCRTRDILVQTAEYTLTRRL